MNEPKLIKFSGVIRTEDQMDKAFESLLSQMPSHIPVYRDVERLRDQWEVAGYLTPKQIGHLEFIDRQLRLNRERRRRKVTQ